MDYSMALRCLERAEVELDDWRGIGERIRDGWRPRWWEGKGYVWGKRLRGPEIGELAPLTTYEPLTDAEAYLIYGAETS